VKGCGAINWGKSSKFCARNQSNLFSAAFISGPQTVEKKQPASTAFYHERGRILLMLAGNAFIASGQFLYLATSN
jgi:hypothetical protein